MTTLAQLVAQFTASIPSDIPPPCDEQCGVEIAVFYWRSSTNGSVVATVHENDQKILFSKWDSSRQEILDIGQSMASDKFPTELESMIRDIFQDGGTQ